MGLFLIIAVAGVSTIIGSFSSNRLGDENTAAVSYARSGLEAVRSIKNRGWDYFTASDCSTSCGVDASLGQWSWLGAGNTSGKYSRIIKVSPVLRNTTGEIVESGGIEDPDTKRVESVVSWDFSSARSNSVSLTTYLTNFLKPISLPDGILIFGNNTGIPKFRQYNRSTDTFGTEMDVAPSLNGRSYVLRASPAKDEIITGFVSPSGVLNVLCYDGSRWFQEWSANVGGTGSTKRFDIAYETSSGDVMVLYGTGSSGSNEMSYRTKSGSSSCGGSNWENAVNLDPVRTSGTVHWIKLTWDRRTDKNLIAAAWADSNSDLSAMMWDGSSWTNEPSNVTENSLEIVSSSQDIDDFDLEFESGSGDLMLIWANSSGSNKTNGVRYRTCTGGNSGCSWSQVNTPPNFTDDATNLDLSANPNNDEMVFASVGNAADDLQAGYWSGTGWTNTENLDPTVQSPLAGTRLVATGWLISGNTSRSIVVYNDLSATNIGYYVGQNGTFTRQSDFAVTPSLSRPQKWFSIETNPLEKNQLMLGVSDGRNNVYFKRLVMDSAASFVWTNSDGSSNLALLQQPTGYPFTFAYRRK